MTNEPMHHAEALVLTESPPITDREQAILSDPAASFWLKRNVLETRERDPVDAVRDAELLATLLRQRSDAAFGGDGVVCTDLDVAEVISDFNRAINFAIETDEATAFLIAWREGDWETIANEWPEFPLPRDGRNALS